MAFNGGLRCPESQSHVLVPSSSTLADLCALCALGLLVDENMRLLLVGTLRLHGQFRSHDCGVERRFLTVRGSLRNGVLGR